MYLIILGILPPPRGGVSTHIERLIPYLEEAKIDFVIWDHSAAYKKKDRLISMRKEPMMILRHLVRPGTKVLHYPLSSVSFGRTVFLFFMKIMRVRITITLVGSPEQTIGKSYIKLLYALTVINFSGHVVAVNANFKNMLVDNGVPGNKISVIPAFIPLKNKALMEQPIPHNEAEFISNHKPLIITYASGPVLYKGKDLYGLDLIVEMAQKLRNDLPRVGIMVIMPEITQEGYFQEIRRDIRERGLEPLFCFVIGDQFSFVSFLKYADLFIRATNTDGDALTLREACYYGVASVASDVSPRPDGALLLRNRDAQDLCRAVRQALGSDKKLQPDAEAQKENNATLFIKIFKQAAGVKD